MHMQRSTTNKRPIIADVNPKSPISEAYRTLRTNIAFSAVDEDIRVIMLTSAGAGEGKSTTVSNLAVTYAQAEKKVLIIDADLRKPTMHHTFHVSNRQGLTSVLSGQSAAADAITETHIPNLSLMTSGPVPPNPSEMLASKRLLMLIDNLKESYDLLLFDTPPAMAVTDAQVVSTLCDGVVLIINAGEVKRDLAQKVKMRLEHVNARILGVVLNNIDRKDGQAYYYYYYGNAK